MCEFDTLQSKISPSFPFGMLEVGCLSQHFQATLHDLSISKSTLGNLSPTTSNTLSISSWEPAPEPVVGTCHPVLHSWSTLFTSKSHLDNFQLDLAKGRFGVQLTTFDEKPTPALAQSRASRYIRTPPFHPPNLNPFRPRFFRCRPVYGQTIWFFI
jgi:hypothetical protein